jgi:protein-S-isoprenylcysteine O-methyltransferase Ste14
MHHAGMFDVVFLAMFALCLAIRVPLQIRNRKIRAAEAREGLFGRFCLLLVFAGSTMLPFLYLFTPWFDFADYAVRLDVGGVGTALAVFGVFLFWKSHRALGRQLYTALFFTASAQLLLIGNAIVGPAFLVAFSILYASRIEHDEDLMLDHFGQADAEYKTRTNRLLPFFRE